MNTTRRTFSLILAAVAAVSALLGAASSAHAAGAYAYGAWSSVQTLTDPKDVAYAQDGEVFVADGAGRRIVVYSADTGAFLREFNGSEKTDGTLVNPVALAIGPTDTNLYVADMEADRIAVFSRAGSLLYNITADLNGPSDLTFGIDGNLYVADMFNNRVRVVSTNGVVVRTITGSGSSLISLPTGVATTARLAASEELYISESNRVRVFSVTGTYRGEWGITYGTQSTPSTSRYGNLAGIEAVRASTAVDPTIYVIDRGKLISREYQIIEKCTWAGAVQFTLSGSGLMQYPEGMTPFSAGYFLIADTGNARVLKAQVASPNNSSVFAPTAAATAAKMQVKGAAAAPDGSYYVSDTKSKHVYKYDASGNLLLTFGASSTHAAPAGLAVSADGSEVFVCEPASSTVQVYNSSGTRLRTLGGSGQFSSPVVVAVRADGNLAVGDETRKRVLFVSKLDASTVAPATEQITGTVAGVALGADGKVYVSDSQGDAVIRFSSAGVREGNVVGYGTAPGFVDAPAGLAFGASGRLIVADRGNHRIQWLDLSGSASPMAFGVLGAGKGNLRAPQAVSPMSDNRVLIADTDNGRAVQARLDSSKPVTSFTGEVNTWVNHPVTVTLTPTDEGSGPAYTYYRLNGGAPQVYTNPIVISTEGNTSIAFWSVDRVGNLESELMVYARIDLTPPAGTTTFGDGVKTNLKPGPIRILSEYTGASQMRLGTVANPGLHWVDIARDATITVTAEGPTTLLAEYRDLAGNILTRTYNCIIDGTGPSTSVMRSGTQASLGLSGSTLVQALPSLPTGGPMTVYTGPVTASLAANDALTSIAEIRYRFDSGPEQTYLGPWMVPSSGVHSVEAWAVDGAGNEGAHTTWTFGISRLPLGAPLTLGDGTGDINSTTLPWSAPVQDATKVSWDVGAGMSPESNYDPNLNWTATLPGADNDYLVTVRFKDPIGVVVDLLGKITLDRTAPQVSVTTQPVPAGWTSAPTLINLGASDVISSSEATPTGIAAIKYRLDSGPETTYTAAMLVTAEGAHSVQAWAVDRAGNSSPPTTRAFSVSQLPLGGVLRTASGATSIATSTVTMSTTIQGAQKMRWSTGSGWSAPDDPSKWQPFTSSFDVSFVGDGPKVVTAQFVDAFSQVNTLTADVIVDRSGPSTAITHTPSATSTAGPVTMSLTATDTYSSVSRIYYKVNGGSTRTYLTPFTLSTEGSYTVNAWSVDSAGNQGPTVSRQVIVTKLLLGGTVSIANGAVRTNKLVVPATVAAQSATQMCWSTGGAFTSWVPYSTSPFNVTLPAEQGVRTLTVRVRDRFGVVNELSDTIVLDTLGPVTTFDGAPTSGISNGPVLLHFTASDASPVSLTQYSLDGAAWRTYSAPVLVATGSHRVSYKSTDVLGNVEPAKTSTFTISVNPLVGTMTLNGGKSFTNTTMVNVAMSVPSAATMRFDTGSGWSAPVAYAPTATLTLPDDGFYWIKAAFNAATGAETTLAVPIVVDRRAPTLSGYSLSVKAFRPSGSAFYYWIGSTAKAADAHPDASSVGTWRWTVGTYKAYTAGSASIYGPRHATYYPTVTAYDRAGNSVRSTGKLRLGAASGPVVPSVAYANRYFAVRGSVPVIGSGSGYRILCYQRYSNGVWYLKKAVAATPTISWSTARISKKIYLPRGTWRVVIGTYRGSYFYASAPSAVIAVK